MSTNQTPVYGLNQWSLEDGVIMEEFNADNRSIEQALLELKEALPKFQTGSYTGTGAYGSSSPNTLTFDFVPKLVLVTCSEGRSENSKNSAAATLFIQGTESTCVSYEQGGSILYLTWTANSLSWYMKSDSTGFGPLRQLNMEGVVYHYIAIG